MIKKTAKTKLEFRNHMIGACLSIGVMWTAIAHGSPPDLNPPYPRLASRPHGTFLTDSRSAIEADARHVAKHHVAIMPTHRTWSMAGFDLATLPGYIKSFNPKVILIKYTNANQFAHSGNNGWIKEKLSSEKGGSGRGDWWKRNASGEAITGFDSEGSWQVNISLQTTPDRNGLRWMQWWARYWNAAPTDSGDWVAPAGYNKGRGLREGKWDGVYLDTQYIETSVNAVPDADYNNDGAKDAPADDTTRTWVVAGQKALVAEWRNLQPNRFVLAQYGALCGSSEPNPFPLQGVYDGGLIQDVNRKERQNGGWSIPMKDYRRGMALAGGSKIVIFHNKIADSIEDNPGITSVYRWNRYWLASALLDNGYYGVMAPGDVRPEYDEFFGGNDHSVEKLGYLGYPIDPPQTSAWSQGVYKREFDNGLVLVNPKGNGTKTVEVGPGWKRISGSQDPQHNNGQAVSSVTLQAQDGIILLRQGGAVARPNPPELGPVT